MTRSSYLRTGWIHVKTYTPAVIAAALMYGGLHQIISVLKYLLTRVILQGINALIRQSFRDIMPLPNNYHGAPWQFDAKVAGIGIIVAGLGMFIGFWAQARSRARPAP